jgi:hypothetical protein
MLNMRARERSGRLFIYVSLLFLFLKKISKRKRKINNRLFLNWQSYFINFLRIYRRRRRRRRCCC